MPWPWSFLRAEDDAAEIWMRKKLLLGVLLVSFVSLFPPLFELVAEGPEVVQVVLYAVRAVLTVVFLLYLIITRTCTTLFTELVIVSLGLYISIVTDFRNYWKEETWSIGIVAMDLLLICGCRKWAVNVMLYSMILYLLFTYTVQMLRFPLFDYLPPLSTRPRPQGSDHYAERGQLSWAYFQKLFVFITDFAVTRHFAAKMRAEQAEMAQSIRVAQRIAVALNQFDLDEAEGLVDRKRSPLFLALSDLLANLRSYRPYLPDALFPTTMHHTFIQGLTRGPPSGRVGIVFTDIVSSTLMWEACPTGMRKAMAVHDIILRNCVDTCNGYEVKTIGDAFMVAFDTALDACRFALMAQDELYLTNDWGEDLLDLFLCEPVPGLWNGPRVRMGVHVGDTASQMNPVTGRGDYFGHNVNIAARVERIAWSGTVAVTEAVWNELDMLEVGCPATTALGAKELKGIEDPINIYLLVPAQLAKRLHCTSPSGSPVHRGDSLSQVSMSTVSAPSRSLVGQELGRSVGTAAWVRVEYAALSDMGSPAEAINLLLGHISDCLERTGGRLSLVSTSSVVGTWNISSPCSAHPSQAAHFAATLHRRRQGRWYSASTSMGIASGRILHGSVGSLSQRFMVHIGATMELAAGLASAASGVGTFALLAAFAGTTSAADDPSTRLATRQVDSWVVSGCRVSIFELNVAALEQWGVEHVEAWGWSDSYREALSRGDHTLIRRHGECEGDCIALHVADILLKGGHLVRMEAASIP